jgi:hypothetical protein
MTDLSRIAWKCINEFFHVICPQAGKDAVPGAISCPQTSGNLLNWHPHTHYLVSDGLFAHDGTFYQLPQVTTDELDGLTRIFRARVIEMLKARAGLSEELAENILSWRYNSGFSVHNQVRIEAADRQGLEQLARYIIRSPLSLCRLELCPNGTIIYHANNNKIHPGFKANFRIFDPMTFLAQLCQHTPERRTKKNFFYGHYSNAGRGKRKREATNEDELEVLPASSIPLSVRKRWARLIAKIYKVNPLICSNCGGLMKIKNFVLDPQDIEDIMTSLGIEFAQPHNNSPPDQQPLVYESIEQVIPSDDDYLRDC